MRLFFLWIKNRTTLWYDFKILIRQLQDMVINSVKQQIKRCLRSHCDNIYSDLVRLCSNFNQFDSYEDHSLCIDR